MNGLSRKLHALEDNLLEFPPDDEDILMFIGDADEQTLHDKAEKIRETLRPQAKAIINDTTLTLEEQEQASKALLSELDDYQKNVLEQSSKFIDYRLRQLVCKYFEAAYPEERDTRVQLRVLWFFDEMKKFNKLNKLEDWAFEHNRNEEAPGFDDFKWWEDMEAEKLRRERFKLDCSPNLPKCTICSRAFQAYIIEKARELNRSFSFKDYPEINHDLFRKLILMLKKSGRVLPMKLRTNPRFFILTEWKDRYPTMTENNRVKPKFPSDEESLEETQGGS